jgi:hypothetical protein
MLWGWEVDGTGSGLCPMAGFGISNVEPLGSATRVSQLVRRIIGKYVVRMGGRWNWLRIVSGGGLCISSVESIVKGWLLSFILFFGFSEMIKEKEGPELSGVLYFLSFFSS